MRIVLDTNVFISGIFWSGPPFQILNAWQAGQINLVVTAEILEEYSRVANILAKKYPEINISEFIDLVTLNSELYQAIELEEPVSPDPDDDKFIACAISSKTKIIVSGDSDLLQVSGYQDIEVFKSKAFIEKYL